MAELKTKPTGESVESFLDAIADERKRADAYAILALMREVTGEAPRMWGPSIVGFGSYHYKYATGREGDWPLTGFSPRKRNLTLYVGCDIERYANLLKKLGKHTTGKGCLYVKRLDDIHLPTLKELVKRSVKDLRKSGQ
ncbi:MAG: DUF1801 domain-containing protein [Planctomycetales bacterium]